MAPRPGRLVVFEGAEGAGKTTQLRRLAARLASAGVAHRVVREPGHTPVGDEIRRLLLDPATDLVPRAEALLFMASRAQLVERELRPALAAGEVVLADRFFLSTYAYQGAGRGLPLEALRAANAVATVGLVPDATLLLDLPVADGLARADARGARDRMERSGDEFHARVAAAFADFARPAWQAEHPEVGPVLVIDARGSEDDVAARIGEVLARRWPETFALSMESHQA
jgi:dTMP kinase